MYSNFCFIKNFSFAEAQFFKYKATKSTIAVVVVVVLLFDIVHEQTKEHKSITVQKDVKEHRITVRFSSQGAPFNLTNF